MPLMCSPARLVGVALLLLLACRGRSDERRAPARGKFVRPVGPPPAALAPSAFRPRMPPAVDSGGRCREDFYMTSRGFRAVTWRRDDASDRWWRIDVATDSSGAVRRYFEDRYAGSAGRTMIRVDFDAGWGSAENSIPGDPAQTTQGDARAFFHAPTLDDPSGRAARVLERCRVSLDPWGVLVRFPDSLPRPPEPRPLPRAPSVDRSFTSAVLGVAYLRAGAGATNSMSSFEWLGQVILPIYDDPAGPLTGWLARGWLALRSSSSWSWKELTVGGWIGIGYEEVGLPVLRTREDGWLRFRYAAPVNGHDGTAWAHGSHLALGDAELSIRRWEEHFLHQDVPTFFKEPGRHPLRRAPGDTSELLHWLEGRAGDLPEYSVAPLEVAADWMRVRVQWPGGWCGTKAQRTAEGWIRWTLPDKGPLLAPRGFIC